MSVNAIYFFRNICRFCGLFLLVFRGQFVMAEQYKINIPSLQANQLPVIDGVFDYQNPTEWSGASGGVIGLGKITNGRPDLTDIKSHFKVARKENTLYVLIYTTELPRMPKSAVRANNGPVWQDDSFELCVSIADRELHLIVNSKGFYYSTLDSNQADCGWRVAVSEIGQEASIVTGDVPRGFVVEASIDLGAIGINLADGQNIGLQVAFNYDGKNPYATWNPFEGIRIKEALGRAVLGGEPQTVEEAGKIQRAKGITQIPFDIVASPFNRAFYLFAKKDIDENLSSLGELNFEITHRDEIIWQQNINIADITDFNDIFIPWKDWPIGNYQFNISDLSKDGERRILFTKNLIIQEDAEWAHYKLPPDIAKVPAPFEPLQANQRYAKIWGRELTFGGSPFIDQIKVLGEDFLYAPVALQGNIDGVQQIFKISKWELISFDEEKAVYRSAASAGKVRLEVKVLVEFDGFIYFECAISPEKSVTVKDMYFLIPIKREFAKYYYHFIFEDFSFNDLSTWNKSGKITDNGLNFRWTPFVWIGDENKGLQWFCESRNGWNPVAKDRYIGLEANKNYAALKLNILTKKTEVKKELTYSFGLMPTPVKPRPYKNDWCGPRAYVDGDYGLMLTSNEGMRYPSIVFPCGKEEFLKEYCLEIDFQVKPEFYQVDRNYLVFQSSWSYNSQFIQLMYNSKAKSFYLHSRGPRCPINVEYDFKPLEKYRLAINFGKKIELYVNGKLIKSADYQGPLPEWDRSAYHEIGGDDRILYGWRFSNRPKSVNEVLDTSDFDKENITFHLDKLQTDPTIMRVADSEVASLSHPAYLNGQWEYDKKNKCLISGQAYPQMTRAEHFRKIVGADTAILFYWSRNILGHDGFENEEVAKKLMNLCNSIGLRVLPYAPHGITNKTPNYEYHKYDFSNTHPSKEPQSWWSERGQRAFGGNGNVNRLRNLWQIEKIMEYGAGGLYMDGGFYPSFSENPLTSKILPDQLTGKPIKHMDILPIRELMKDYKRILQKYRSDAIIDAHASLGWTIPTMSQVDVATNGESLAWYGDDWQSHTDLPTIAAEFSGRAFGFKGEALFYQSKPVPVEYGMTLMGLFGSSPRCNGWGMYPQRAQALWELADKFGVESADWMIFSRPKENAFKPDNRNVLCSAFVHKGKRALLLATNWSDQPCNSKIAIDFKSLGLPTETPIHLLNNNIALQSNNGVIELPLKPRKLMYVWIGNGY